MITIQALKRVFWRKLIKTLLPEHGWKEMEAMSRQEFEDWVLSHGGNVDRTDGGEYRSAPTECAWDAWRAAIENVRKYPKIAQRDTWYVRTWAKEK